MSLSKVESNSSVVVTDFPLCPGETRYELKFGIIFILCPENDIAWFRRVLSEFLPEIFQI